MRSDQSIMTGDLEIFPVISDILPGIFPNLNKSSNGCNVYIHTGIPADKEIFPELFGNIPENIAEILRQYYD